MSKDKETIGAMLNELHSRGQERIVAIIRAELERVLAAERTAREQAERERDDLRTAQARYLVDIKALRASAADGQSRPCSTEEGVEAMGGLVGVLRDRDEARSMDQEHRRQAARVDMARRKDLDEYEEMVKWRDDWKRRCVENEARAERAEADNAALRKVIAAVTADAPGRVARVLEEHRPIITADHPGAALLERLRKQDDDICRLAEEVEAWTLATGLERGGGPDGVRPEDLAKRMAHYWALEKVREAVEPLVDEVLRYRGLEGATSLFLASDNEPGPEVLDASGLDKLLAAADAMKGAT